MTTLFTKTHLAFFAFASLLASANIALAYDEDYPMFSAYPGADREHASMVDYERTMLPLSVVDEDKTPAFAPLILVGDIYRQGYEIQNVSSLKVFENYLTAAKSAGFKELFSCSLEACGTDKQSRDLGSVLAIQGDVYNSYHKPYYWIGEKSSGKGKIIAAWYVAAYDTDAYVQQVIVETEPAETHLIQINAAYTDPSDGITREAELSAEDKSKDHPMLPRYPGAKLDDLRKTDTEVFSFPKAKNAVDKTPLKLTGDLYRHEYGIRNTSTLKIYQNYQTALAKAGFSIISQCELIQCGSDDDAQNLGGLIAIDKNVYNNHKNPYYLLVKKQISDKNVYIALFIGAYGTDVKVHQTILEEKSVQTGLITVNADELKQQIETDGKALIYGIYFDTGKASIKPESKPTLDAIGELLKKNPSLLLYVVGHTDDTGSVTANLELSQQRAKSVVDALTSGYQIAANRLQAAGVGPYAPASNNTSDSGKQKNRRVELVKRLR